MWPVLITIGNIPISSFGFFLLISLLTGAFFIWRVIRVYDFNEEKTLDLILLTFLGGLIGARVYFILSHLNQFDGFFKLILINRYPGLSFWGSFLGGFLTLSFFSKRLKVNFWQIADYASVGLFISLSLASLGCLLGSCGYGQVSNLPLAIPQSGLIGKRFPLQFIEAILTFLGFLYLYRKVLRFHTIGQIAALGLILLGLIKLGLQSFRGDTQLIYPFIDLSFLWSLSLIFFGLKINYQLNKKSPLTDIKFLGSLLTNSNRRRMVISKINKSCYNFKVNLRHTLYQWRKNLFRLLNIKSNPSNF